MKHCEKCSSTLDWRECWDCGGEGFSDHDCGEDTCCCYMPQLDVVCSTCNGEGGWTFCPGCQPQQMEDSA